MIQQRREGRGGGVSQEQNTLWLIIFGFDRFRFKLSEQQHTVAKNPQKESGSNWSKCSSQRIPYVLPVVGTGSGRSGATVLHDLVTFHFFQ